MEFEIADYQTFEHLLPRRKISNKKFLRLVKIDQKEMVNIKYFWNFIPQTEKFSDVVFTCIKSGRTDLIIEDSALHKHLSNGRDEFAAKLVAKIQRKENLCLWTLLEDYLWSNSRKSSYLLYLIQEKKLTWPDIKPYLINFRTRKVQVNLWDVYKDIRNLKKLSRWTKVGIKWDV